MTLGEQLEAQRARSATRLSEEQRAVMHRATQELRRSGIVERALKIGDNAPHFELRNPRGDLVRSRDLLARGPLVVSFYRGVW